MIKLHECTYNDRNIEQVCTSEECVVPLSVSDVASNAASAIRMY
jgi:hypothetical protein